MLDSAELRDIRCVAASARIVDPALVGKAKPAPSFRIGARAEVADSSLVYWLRYEFPLVAGEEVAACVEGEFQATYTLPSGGNPEQDEVERFSVEAVAPAIHPYVREFVSAMYFRIGINVPIMGSFKVADAALKRD